MSEEDVKGFFAHFINEWPQIAPGYNWRTFHPLMIELEHDEWLGGVEASVIVLGIGVRFRWTYTVSATMAKIIRETEDIKSGKAKTRPWSEFRDEMRGGDAP
jgi:hypothetical protein